MVEGDNVFKEAIAFLKSLPSLKPLQWEPMLAKSAQEHVDDIGPKGLLLYQSSNGTEPEDRITKYGNYVESLGENIDFGPNDAMGVIISLTLDDGEEERPHRENLFKSDYQKVGIACGPHKTEFQMCVMDFAYDFQPLNAGNEQKNDEPEEKYPYEKQMNMNMPKEKEVMKNIPMEGETKFGEGNEIDQLTHDTLNINNNKKVISKKVEIETKIIYTYEDGSTRVVTQNESHEYKD
jgi:hypothetical protein